MTILVALDEYVLVLVLRNLGADDVFSVRKVSFCFRSTLTHHPSQGLTDLLCTISSIPSQGSMASYPANLSTGAKTSAAALRPRSTETVRQAGGKFGRHDAQIQPALG